MTTTPPSVYCPACGRQIPADAGFCRGCGHHLAARSRPAAAEPAASSVPETKACPDCDAQVPVAAQFCASCGRTVTADVPPAEPATLVPSLTPEPPAAPQPTPSAAPGRRFNGRAIAIAAAAVVLVGGGIAAALALTGDPSSPSARAANAGTRSDPAAVAAATPEATVATPTPTPTPTPEATVATATPDSDAQAPSVDPTLATQVRTLDALMQLSEQGRGGGGGGGKREVRREQLKPLRQLQSLRAAATDARLQAAVDPFIAAIREALRQNRECGSACSAADLARVARLKGDALSKLNPLLREYVGRTYRLEEI
jgi:hypothetical protein